MAGSGHGMAEKTGGDFMKLNELFQSNMVLQQGKPCLIWGTARPGTRITATIQGKTVTVIVSENEAASDEAGDTNEKSSEEAAWMVRLPALTVSASERLLISDGTEEILLENVAVGEVWIAGGQSNMEFWMHYEKHLQEEKPVCENPLIRFYDVPKIAYDGQREEFDYSQMAVWRTCSEENIDYFTGVGYYFAKKLQRDLGIPIGIIGCNWGGTTSSVWMKEESVKKVGQPWIADHEQAMNGRDMEEFWTLMHGYAENDTGRPFENEFNNLVLYKTPPDDEMMQYFIRTYTEGKARPDLMGIMPSTFPGALYEHMLRPLSPVAVRGVIWYQGESDEPHADIYGRMLKQLVEDWRELWEEKIPFLMVQLPGYESWFGTPQTQYNELREAQKWAADNIDNCWITSISDVGEQYDIHPKDKKTPGERLALLAEGKVYGEQLLCEAPYPSEVAIDGDEIRIRFEHASGGLVTEGEKLHALELVPEQDFSWHIEGEELVLVVPHLRADTKIRFAKQLFYQVNLKNRAGIPAMPFEYEME